LVDVSGRSVQLDDFHATIVHNAPATPHTRTLVRIIIIIIIIIIKRWHNVKDFEDTLQNGIT